ncbi:methyl-accepting chemotaxis protein [Ekhidna sp.]|uniref:methyl-accepting chemotaxis protein n=1 Tax=Ekhidna sp. TaxID=2608089 RepID=UPI003296D568
MNLRLKIAIFIGGLLLITVTIISTVTVLSIQAKSEEDIAAFRKDEFRKARLRLENVVDMAYGIVTDAYNTSDDRDQSLQEALRVLSQIRFDGTEGYFWITDIGLPYPTMVMHAAKPQNQGKVMSDKKYNVVQGKPGKNLYQERVEQSLAHDTAFVDYYMVKPDEDKEYSKLSYSKLFKELGWVISSGIYTDSIDEAVQSKKDELSDQLAGIVYKVIGISLILLLLGLWIGFYFSNQLVDAIVGVRDRLILMSKGRKVEKIDRVRKDEIGDMTTSLNQLVDSSITYTKFAIEISRGNLEGDFGLFDEENVLGSQLERMRQNLRQVVSETNEALHQANEQGNLNAQISTDEKRGVWKEMAESVNNLLQSVAQPIFSVNKIVNAMAEGDLSQRLENNNKGDIQLLTDNLNKAQSQLNALLSESVSITANVEGSASEMLVTGEEMSRSTDEIASATSQMSSGAQSQVQKVDEVSQLIEGVLSTSSGMQQKARAINSAAKQGSDKSQKGGEMLNELKVNISDILEYTTKSSASIEVLKGRSNEINQVLSVITEIASQTNLLALNAAIEAAQAGDAGRGFAVVAEEIRKLAEDSRKSATRIEQLILDVQKDTQETSKAMSEMSQRVQSGTAVSSAALEIFNEITASSNHTLVLSEEIVSATENQLTKIQDVVVIIEGVVVIAEQTAAGTEEVASSAVELASGMENYKTKSTNLSEIASGLKNELSKFILKT